MAKVKLVSPGQLQAIAGCLPDEQAFGEVQTRLGVCGSFPLHAGFRIMTGGSAIAWQAAASGRVILVWEGVARVGETILGVESAGKGATCMTKQSAFRQVDVNNYIAQAGDYFLFVAELVTVPLVSRTGHQEDELLGVH